MSEAEILEELKTLKMVLRHLTTALMALMEEEGFEFYEAEGGMAYDAPKSPDREEPRGLVV